MSILITGAPGSGKTSISRYAEKKGDTRFIDADDFEDLCIWVDRKTGEVLAPTNEYLATGDEWFEKYEWIWKLDFLESYLAKHPDTILCGSSDNVLESFGLFDKIIFLKKTKKELVSNLTHPSRSNPYGKTEKQREDLFDWQSKLIKAGEKFNSVIIEGNDIAKIYNEIKKLL